MFTAQQIFDITTTHLFAQDGVRCFGQDYCRYRGKSDSPACTRCAVGLYIPDLKYFEGIEGCTIAHHNNELKEFLSEFIDPKHYELLQNLQEVHDGISTSMRSQYLIEVAQDFKLDAKLVKLLFDGTMPETPLADQTVFDAVVVWLWAQGNGRCSDEEGRCRYRHENKVFALTRCAAGLFMPDSVYESAHYESVSCSDIDIFKKIVANGLLLKRLQICHDDFLLRVSKLAMTCKAYELNDDILNLLFNTGV